MKRRAVLKRLGLASAAIVATPTVISLLHSCSTEPKLWAPQFLSIEEGQALRKMVDVFLPKSDTPSGTEVNIPEFIDRYISEVYDTEDQLAFKDAYAKMLVKLKNISQKQVDDLEDKDIQNFLDTHLKVKGEIDTERQDNPNYEGLTTSECLNAIRGLCIGIYLRTEKIGEEVLAYDPVPGAYYCGDLEELTQGKRWSLD